MSSHHEGVKRCQAVGLGLQPWLPPQPRPEKTTAGGGLDNRDDYTEAIEEAHMSLTLALTQQGSPVPFQPASRTRSAGKTFMKSPTMA